MLPLSILDLAPITEGSDARQAFANMADLARHAEALGYARYWLAEHHNMPGIASAATAVLVGHVAGATRSIRVGAGGVMLPNHAPLQVAEQFGTLASLYPGRIDLGLGRAPGTDQAATRALRRYYTAADEFPADVVELLGYFDPVRPGQAVQAVPGAGIEVEPWILGSSLFGAMLAAKLGLRYAFASHFAPDLLAEAIAAYRRDFTPSKWMSRPHVMLALNVVCADNDAEAQRLFTTQQQAFINLRRGMPGLVRPPLPHGESIDRHCAPHELAMIERALACAAVGSQQTVASVVSAFVDMHAPDELLFTANIFDHEARKASFARAFEVVRRLAS